jgi:hypothetical protein
MTNNNLTPPARISLPATKPDFDTFVVNNWTPGIPGECTKVQIYNSLNVTVPNSDCIARHRHNKCASCREFIRISLLYKKELQKL